MTQQEAMSGGKWRVGSRVPLNVYLDDKPMFQCHTPEDAAMVVALLNRADDREARIDELRRMVRLFKSLTFDGLEVRELRRRIAELKAND